MSLFQGLSALIIDDESLLSHELAAALEDAGCTTVIVSRTPEAARSLIGTSLQIDLAVMEIAAGEQSALPLAQDLLRGGTRIVMTSARSDTTGRLRTISGLPVLEKPYLVAEVVSALAKPDVVSLL